MKLLTHLSSFLLLASPAVFAHPGHAGSDSLFHGLLHTEHLAVLFAIAAILSLGYYLYNKR